LYALESPFYVPLNTRLRGSIVREILDACLYIRDAKPLQFPGNFVRKADIERVPTDRFLYLSLTKRMIVEENPQKWKIFFRNYAFDTPKGINNTPKNGKSRLREGYRGLILRHSL
jgi:hypothetical protein